MPQSKKIPVFSSLAMDTTQVFSYKLNANFGFFLQWFWTGLTGTGLIKIYMSTDGIHWSIYPVTDKKNKILTEIPLTLPEDNDGVQLNNFRGDFIKVVFESSASAGTITAQMDVQEINNSY